MGGSPPQRKGRGAAPSPPKRPSAAVQKAGSAGVTSAPELRAPPAALPERSENFGRAGGGTQTLLAGEALQAAGRPAPKSGSELTEEKGWGCGARQSEPPPCKKTPPPLVSAAPAPEGAPTKLCPTPPLAAGSLSSRSRARKRRRRRSRQQPSAGAKARRRPPLHPPPRALPNLSPAGAAASTGAPHSPGGLRGERRRRRRRRRSGIAGRAVRSARFCLSSGARRLAQQITSRCLTLRPWRGASGPPPRSPRPPPS